MTALKLGLILKKDGLTAFNSLKEGLKPYKDMAEFVLSGDKLYWLMAPEGKADWNIEQISIQEVARAFQ